MCMRSLRLIVLALLVTAARADFVTDVYAQFFPGQSTPSDGIGCSAVGNPSSCSAVGHYSTNPGSLAYSFGIYSYDVDLVASASSSVTAATFDYVDVYPRNEAFQAGSSQVLGDAGFGDTIDLGGPKGQPAFAEFLINPYPDASMDNRFCDDFPLINEQLSWFGSFTCDPNPPGARYFGDWALVQPIQLGEPFTFYMDISQMMPLDLGNDDVAFYLDTAYSVASIQVVDSNGNPITGLNYSTASGTKYQIEGATYVPEPTCSPQKQKSSFKRPPLPGDTHDASRQASTLSQHGNRRAVCVCGRWTEPCPGWAPELQDLMRSEVVPGCSGVPTH